ncbi:hypothetical protein UlMin_022916 [Ulmus minor]
MDVCEEATVSQTIRQSQGRSKGNSIVIEPDSESVEDDSDDETFDQKFIDSDYEEDDRTFDHDYSNEEDETFVDDQKSKSKKKLPKFPKFKEDTDMANPMFRLGQIFNSNIVFKQAVKEHAIREGRKIRFIMNVKRVEKTHFLDYKWIVKNYTEFFKHNRRFSAPKVMTNVQRDRILQVSRSQVYRAKELVVQMIEGTYAEQYALLWDYCEELRKKNPVTTEKIKVETGPNDGCHTKGPFSGQLLSAVGANANNCMYPIVYSIVEQENKDTWSLFMGLLMDDLVIESGRGWNFITDRQKRLVQVLEELLSEAKHRYCVRHMYNNFNKKH